MHEIGIRALTDADREAISRWRYGGDLAIYEPGEGARELRAPDHVAVTGVEGTLIGYGTFGAEARVPGGTYDPDPQILDIGLGLRPDLVGAGRGAAVLRALLDEARRRAPVRRFRATVAAVNGRATALVLGLGFVATVRFERARDGRQFVQYERAATSIAE